MGIDVAISPRENNVWVLEDHIKMYDFTNSQQTTSIAISDKNGYRITIDTKGKPWLLKSSGTLRKYQDDGTYEDIAGVNANDIRIGYDGQIWLVNAYGELIKYEIDYPGSVDIVATAIDTHRIYLANARSSTCADESMLPRNPSKHYVDYSGDPSFETCFESIPPQSN